MSIQERDQTDAAAPCGDVNAIAETKLLCGRDHCAEKQHVHVGVLGTKPCALFDLHKWGYQEQKSIRHGVI